MQDLKKILKEIASISEEEYEQALQITEQNSISILHACETLGIGDQEKLLEAFSSYFGCPIFNLDQHNPSQEILNLIPKEIVQSFRVFPIRKSNGTIELAVGNPRNLDLIDTIRFKLASKTKLYLASELQITQAIEKFYGKMDFTKVQNPLSASENQLSQERKVIGLGKDKDDGPIIKLVNDILIQCANKKASDIHIENYENSMRIRFRIDGSLHEIATPPIGMKQSLISRIKIMAGINIAETRLPQDGSINISIADKPVDFRVNTLPTLYGEKIVMRILDKSNLQVDMTQLGFEKDQLLDFKSSIDSPHGMVLVTGPTGSGKTTTLYSALQELNKEEVNIMTAEDPVEYNLNGINQVQMKPEIGLDFAASLRAFLRQDPDIIMVGEIRDLETAEIAMKASLTGHLVLSTLHTNSAVETISRLLNMGVANYNLISSLTCVTAQRLLKKICTRCRKIDSSVQPQTLIKLGIPNHFANQIKVYIGIGCPACQGLGTKGRIAIHEVLILNEKIRKAILNHQSSLEIFRIANENGMRSLRQSALAKMVQGQVSISEVLRSTTTDGA